MKEMKESIRLMENLYAVERIVTAMEKEPKYYGTEELLYANEVHTLKMVAQQEGITQKELTEMMLRTKGATSVMIKKLEKKGLITREEDEKDARALRLYLTEKGKRVHQCHLEYDEKVIGFWMKELEFSWEEISTANYVLEKYIRYVGDWLGRDRTLPEKI
jgi:DNA-binding MarR family transcriptional regulator